jgi:F0F1-type ATP synthase assembly protein I
MCLHLYNRARLSRVVCASSSISKIQATLAFDRTTRASGFLLAGHHIVPTSSSDLDDRSLVGRILRMQIAVGAAVALASLCVWGRIGLVSALAGAATGVIGNAYRAFKALQPARTARRALGQLYLAELVSFVLTIALLLLAARMPHVSWPALLLAYVATLVVLWWVPFASTARAKIGSGGESLKGP